MLSPINVNQRVYPPNQYNWCLDREEQLWQRINDCGGLMAICPGRKYEEPPWVKQPPQGKRSLKVSSIALPAFDGLDHLVLSYLIPKGWDGCIVAVVQNYTGQGFAEGSGDITWRLKQNQHYVKDQGASLVSIGSLETPYNINVGAVLCQENQLMQYFVNISPSAAGNLIGGRIICATAGWWWPR